MKNAVSGLGLAPDAAMVTFPIEMFLPGSDIAPVEARKQEFYDGADALEARHLAQPAHGASRLLCVRGARLSRTRSTRRTT